MLSRTLYLPALRAGAVDVPKLVSVDLQPMAAVEGVLQLQVPDTLCKQPICMLLRNVLLAAPQLRSLYRLHGCHIPG